MDSRTKMVRVFAMGVMGGYTNIDCIFSYYVYSLEETLAKNNKLN